MVEVKLTNTDKEELLNFLEKYAKKISEDDLLEIEKKLDKKLHLLTRNKKLPGFAKKMLRQIKDLRKLFKYRSLPEDKFDKIVAALHYFIWAEDRMPDYIPVIGYIDDAFIISVVHNEVKKFLS